MVNVQIAASYSHVASDRSFQQQIPCIAANTAIYVARNAQGPGSGNEVAQNMTGYFDVAARQHQIAFDRAFHADSSSSGVQVAVDYFVFTDG